MKFIYSYEYWQKFYKGVRGPFKIIAIHIGIQVIIGVSFVVFALRRAENIVSGLPFALTYLGVALGCTAVSVILCKIINIRYRRHFRLSIITSSILWLLAPVILISTEVFTSNLTSRTQEEIFEATNLRIARVMGLKNYKWDSNKQCCFFASEDGEKYAFTLVGDYLNIYANIIPPSFGDTIGWFKLGLKGAESFMQPDLIEKLNRRIDEKNYFFEFSDDVVKIRLYLWVEDEYGKTKYLKGEYFGGTNDVLPFGNFRIIVLFDETLHSFREAELFLNKLRGAKVYCIRKNKKYVYTLNSPLPNTRFSLCIS